MISRFWGWGGEDDDLFRRLKIKGYTPSRIEDNFGRFMVRNLISLCKEFDFKTFVMMQKIRKVSNKLDTPFSVFTAPEKFSQE